MNYSQEINEVRNIERNKNFKKNVKCKPLFIVDKILSCFGKIIANFEVKVKNWCIQFSRT